MNRKIWSLIGAAVLCGSSMLAGTGMSEKVSAEEAAIDYASLLTERYWVSDFQAISIFDFQENGTVMKYTYGGTCYGDDGNISADWVPDPENFYYETEMGTYTLENNKAALSTGLNLYLHDVNETIDGYPQDYYNGDYYLYQDDFVEPEEEIPDYIAYYLYAVGPKNGNASASTEAAEDTATSTETATDTSTETDHGWYGVYFHDDGIEGLYIFVNEVTDTEVKGVYMFSGGDIWYDCDTFSWTLDSQDKTEATAHFQGDMYSDYHLRNGNIYIDYPYDADVWKNVEYKYVCTIDEAAVYANHSQLSNALALLNGTSGGSAGTSTAAATTTGTTSGTVSPFYGIWVVGSKDQADCDRVVADLQSKGLPGKVYLTTDWTNLNSEPWYVVSAGEYATEAGANGMLSSIQGAGYSDAYVKYTGDYKY